MNSTALARVEERMDNGEQNIDELRRAIEKSKQSQDELEKRIEKDKEARGILERDIYMRLGSMATLQKVLVTLTSIILVALVGLAFMALKH